MKILSVKLISEQNLAKPRNIYPSKILGFIAKQDIIKLMSLHRNHNLTRKPL